MIDNHNEVEINGIKYAIMWDAGDEAYVESGESLRPPNAQLVQGEKAGYVFQMRPDTLLFSWTDWSGGEGQLKFDPQNPNRAAYLGGVNPFSLPGKLTLGPLLENTSHAFRGSMAPAGGSLYMVSDTGPGDIYVWSSGFNWVDSTFSLGVASVDGGVTGDTDKFYMLSSALNALRSVTPGGTWVTLNDQINNVTAGQAYPTEAYGPYIYVYDVTEAQIFELSNSTINITTPEVPILDLSTEGGTELAGDGIGMLAVGDNSLFALQIKGDQTTIWEILPSTAAGTGFGDRLATVEGFQGHSLWTHMGMVFVAGSTGGDEDRSAVLYFQPGGTYGTLGNIREQLTTKPTAVTFESQGAKKMVESAFAASGYDIDGTYQELQLFLIDHVSGGFCVLAASDSLFANTPNFTSVIDYQGEFFFNADDATTYATYRTNSAKYAAAGTAVSPKWDAGINENKILASLTLVTEPLPGPGSVEVEYNLDSAGWVSAGTMSTTNATSETFTISTDTSTKEFRSAEFRLNLASSSGTATPTVLSLEAQCRVMKGVRAYNMILDAYDDQSQAANSHRRGSYKIENIETAYETEQVVAFKNGARDRGAGVWTEHDVMVDGWRVILRKPGEGLVSVRLVRFD